jgi:hypothetical protein
VGAQVRGMYVKISNEKLVRNIVLKGIADVS